ncbi:MAG: hypothetical protein IAB08_07785 [Bacteroidetes bacterium]|uniref:Uncharacterized protein n=1 Tax=Candidatus Pullibacteroides excrementavium TaxID=2840905 RepID=A0A9D9GZS8_9BACT|nr:hypothetical protein [Candidatus Pullibacteroides excrementavium]
MKLTVTVTESVLILAALHEKGMRIERDTGEAPRGVLKLVKKLKRQIQHDKDKRRREREDKAKACRNPRKAYDNGRSRKSGRGQADNGVEQPECEA